MNEKNSEWEEIKPYKECCSECGKCFNGNDHQKVWLALAGHIMRSEDHYNKKWAKRYLAKHLKKGKHGIHDIKYDFSWIVPRIYKGAKP